MYGVLFLIFYQTWQKAGEAEVEHDVVNSWKVKVINGGQRRRQLARNYETLSCHRTRL